LRTDRRPTTDRQPTTSDLGNFKWPYLREGSSNPLHVLRWGFRGRWIEWRYFRFRQIQDGGCLKNSNCDISVANHPIYSVFGSRTGFSGSADRMALFPVSPNPRWRRSRHLEKFKLRYLREGSSDPLHVWFYVGVFEVGGSNGAISGFAKSKMAAQPPS